MPDAIPMAGPANIPPPMAAKLSPVDAKLLSMDPAADPRPDIPLVLDCAIWAMELAMGFFSLPISSVIFGMADETIGVAPPIPGIPFMPRI